MKHSYVLPHVIPKILLREISFLLTVKNNLPKSQKQIKSRAGTWTQVLSINKDRITGTHSLLELSNCFFDFVGENENEGGEKE